MVSDVGRKAVHIVNLCLVFVYGENHLLRKIRIENAANIEHCAVNINLCIHGKGIVDAIIALSSP